MGVVCGKNPLKGAHRHQGKPVEEDVVDLSAFSGRKANPSSTFTGNMEVDFSLTGFKHRGSAVYGIVVKPASVDGPVDVPESDSTRDRRASRVEACGRGGYRRESEMHGKAKDTEEIISFR